MTIFIERYYCQNLSHFSLSSNKPVYEAETEGRSPQGTHNARECQVPKGGLLKGGRIIPTLGVPFSAAVPPCVPSPHLLHRAGEGTCLAGREEREGWMLSPFLPLSLASLLEAHLRFLSPVPGEEACSGQCPLI